MALSGREELQRDGLQWSSFQKGEIQSILSHCSQSELLKNLKPFNPRTKWTVFNRAYWGGHSLSSSNFLSIPQTHSSPLCHRAFAHADPTAGMFSCLTTHPDQSTNVLSLASLSNPYFAPGCHSAFSSYHIMVCCSNCIFSKCRDTKRKFFFWWLSNVYTSFSISFLAQRGKGSTFLFWRLGDRGSGGNIIWGPMVAWLVGQFFKVILAVFSWNIQAFCTHLVLPSP